MKITPLALLTGLLAVQGLQAATPATENTIKAFGRTIPFQAYLDLPKKVIVDQAAGRVYLAIAAGEAEHLAEIALPAKGRHLSLAAAKALSTVDLSQRNFWGAGYSSMLQRTVVLTDEAGEERTNLYTVEPDGRFKRFTDVGYIYGWSISPDGRWLAYSSRETVEFSPGAVRLIDLKSRAERVLFRDSKALRPYWGSPAWRADNSAFLLPMVVNEDRALQNIALFSVTDGEQAKLLTDKAVRRELVLPREAWVDARQFVYLSTERGALELYVGDPEGKSTQVTQPAANGGNRTSAAVIHVKGKPFAVTHIERPVLDQVQVLALPSGKVVFDDSVAEAVTLESALGGEAILRTNSPSNPGRLLSLTASGNAFTLTPIAEQAQAGDDLVSCAPEKISFSTFDGLSAPGENGTLHAWLYRPKKPLPKDQAMLIVEAFYGGSKTFQSIYPLPVAQLFCAAGIHFLSPSPRGTAELGKEFRHLIRGDIGGNEILDVVEAAKWGHRTLDIPAKRIGAYGLSHGGYATMRLLTLPETVNGHKVDFRFGFGISDAGISNLMRQAAGSNIRGWSLDLMGEEPEKNPAKWLDRSPETHADRISGPLLLLHGSNDIRVRPIESAKMAEKLRALGKPVTYVELTGAAHNTAPIPMLHLYWTTVFDFLEHLNAD